MYRRDSAESLAAHAEHAALGDNRHPASLLARRAACMDSALATSAE
jgi:hypothetical protein